MTQIAKALRLLREIIRDKKVGAGTRAREKAQQVINILEPVNDIKPEIETWKEYKSNDAHRRQMMGLPMDEIKVGMLLTSVLSNQGALVTVTELTKKGFRYKNSVPRTIKLGPYLFGQEHDGECWGINGWSYYRETTPLDMPVPGGEEI